MPRKKKSSDPEYIDYQKVKFVFNNLSESDLETFDASDWSSQDAETLSDNLTKLIDNGFQLSIKYDDYSKGYQITASCRLVGKDSVGYATSARSSDLLDAMRIITYKIIFMAELDLSQFDNEFREVRG